MNIISLGKNYCLLSLVLFHVGSVYSMDQQKRYQQTQRDKAALEKIKNTNPAQFVSVNPNVSFSVKCAASNHNVMAPHHQMQNRYKK